MMMIYAKFRRGVKRASNTGRVYKFRDFLSNVPRSGRLGHVAVFPPPPPLSHILPSPRTPPPPPLKFTVVTVCTLLTRDLFAIVKFLAE